MMFARQRKSLLCLFAMCLGLLPVKTVSAETTDSKIMSLGISVTETVYALNQQHRLVGRDTSSTYPPDVLEVKDVGYIRALAPEGVLSVAPDLIIAEEGAGPRETLDILKDASVEYVEVPNEPTASGIVEQILIVGRALGVEGDAQALADDVAARLADAIAAADAQPQNRKRVLFVLSTRGGKITAGGAGTSADGIIAMAGGVNAIGDVEGWKQLADEAVAVAAPDVILMMDRGGDHGIDNEGLFNMPSIMTTPAAQSKSVIRMNPQLLLGFGPRTPDAVEKLSEALYDPAS
ncbi:MAG: ABC transporter substrate-binding protein [Marinovum sp.]|nr:ABC transporter substrate-binding protein [Marinovum sp.]